MTHLRTPHAAPRLPLLVIAAALTLSTANIVNAQTPVDANPSPPPPATQPADTAPAPPAAPAAPTTAPAPVTAPTVTITPVAPSTPMPAATGQGQAPAPTANIVTPTSGTTPTTATSTVDLNIAARDSRTLNPLLIPTDAELRDALDYGRSLGGGKQDFIDLLYPASRSFDYRKGGMLGEKRRTQSTAVWVTPDVEARWRGFLESRGFADQGKRDSDFATMQQEVTAPQRTLAFIVELGGLIPPHTDPSQQALDGAYTALAGTRFVLSDDHGNNYNPLDTATTTHLVRRQDFYDSLSSGPDRLGQTAFTDSPANEARDLVMRRKPYSDYAAFYVVTFDAFNPDGSARINRDVHTVTLRIVTPDEAKYAVFDVSKMP